MMRRPENEPTPAENEPTQNAEVRSQPLVRRRRRTGRDAPRGRAPGRRRKLRDGEFPESQLRSLGCFAPLLASLCVLVLAWGLKLLELLLFLEPGTLLTDGLGEVLGGVVFNIGLWAWPFTYLLYYAVFIPVARAAWRRQVKAPAPPDE